MLISVIRATRRACVAAVLSSVQGGGSGKVEGMKLAETEIPQAARSKLRAKAQARWLFALAELEVADARPCLVLVGGLPGTGKSTLTALGESAGFSVIRSDVVHKELVAEYGQVTSRSAIGEDFYTEAWNDRTYQECLRRAGKFSLKAVGCSSMRAFTMNRGAGCFWMREGVGAFAQGLILCQSDAAVVRERLARRRSDASDADWAVHSELARRWDDLRSTETKTVTRCVDTGGTTEAAVARAV